MSAPTTYPGVVTDFDHTRFARLPAYPTLRQALSDLADQAECPLGEFLAAVRDAATTTPYADACQDCHTMAWPHRLRRRGDWLTGAYRCAGCDRRWRCGYAVGVTELL